MKSLTTVIVIPENCETEVISTVKQSDPVSYTHLDVYKRQELHPRRGTHTHSAEYPDRGPVAEKQLQQLNH